MAFCFLSANTYLVLEASFHAVEGGDPSVCCCHLVSAWCQPGKDSNIHLNIQIYGWMDRYTDNVQNIPELLQSHDKM